MPDEHELGQWSHVVTTPGVGRPAFDGQSEIAGVSAVHASLMHTGAVLLFSGRKESYRQLFAGWVWTPSSDVDFPPPIDGPAPDSADVEAFRASVEAPFDNMNSQPPEWSIGSGWDPEGDVDSYVPGLDLFCAHQVQLEDGRILVMGGASGSRPGDANGNPAVFIFDPEGGPNYWERLQPPASGQMDDGRWYPTAVMLADGRVVAFSGRRTSGWVNEDVEVFAGPDYAPQLVMGGERKLHIYPTMHLVRGNRVFYTHGTWGYRDEQPTAESLDPNRLDGSALPTASFRMTGKTTGVWDDYTKPSSPAPLTPNYVERREAAAVLLPPAQAGQILLIGGSRRRREHSVDSSGNFEFSYWHEPTRRRVELSVVDFDNAAPPWNVVGGGTLEPNGAGTRWVFHDGSTQVSDGVVGMYRAQLEDAGDLGFRYRNAANENRDLWVEGFGPGAGPWNVRGGGSLLRRPDNRGFVYRDASDNVVSEGVWRTMDGFYGITPASVPDAAEILHTQGLPDDPTSTEPVWEDVGPMLKGRINPNPVLLPDGKVLIVSGQQTYRAGGQPYELSCELFDPETKTFAEVAPVVRQRHYHSTVLLLPDGRVLAASGESNSQHDMQLYKPPYFFINPDNPRMRISGPIQSSKGPGNHVAYGDRFDIPVLSTSGFSRVALIKPSNVTHQIDSDMRYVPLAAWPRSGEMPFIEARAPVDASVAPPGYYMVWVIDNEDRPCERAGWVRLSHRRCEITGRNTYGRDEAQSLINGPEAGRVLETHYIHVDGFLPGELGINGALPIGDAIDGLPVSATFGASGISLRPNRIEPEDASLDPRVRQRFTFVYDTLFTSVSAFPNAETDPEDDLRELTLRFEVQGHRCQQTIRVVDQPNPYMKDGQTHWLSVDLRVFRLKDNDPFLNGARVLGNPLPFIRNIADTISSAQFEQLETEQGGSRLILSKNEGGQPVWNFALARVRFRGSAGNGASGVRCSFRMFQTAVSNMSYQSATTYRSTSDETGSPVPLLGIVGSDNEVVTVPFFAHPRTPDMADQVVVERSFAGTDDEEVRYFGCWLDINQPDQASNTQVPRTLADPSVTGPFAASSGNPLSTVQDWVARGEHQCLVAQIAFGNGLLQNGDTPAGSDKLAQRNLAYAPSDNPGSVTSRVVQHTYDLRPRIPGGYVRNALNYLSAVDSIQGQPRRKEGVQLASDSLMILWGNLPRGTEVEMFMPNADLDTMLDLRALRYGPSTIERADASTLRLTVEGATHLPLVANAPINVAGLMTFRLPQDIVYGQEFSVRVVQIEGAGRTVVGSFEVRIPVVKADQLVGPLTNNYAVLSKAAATLSPSDRWSPVMQAYLQGLGARIRGLGGSPESIPATGAGYWAPGTTTDWTDGGGSGGGGTDNTGTGNGADPGTDTGTDPGTGNGNGNDTGNGGATASGNTCCTRFERVYSATVFAVLVHLAISFGSATLGLLAAVLVGHHWRKQCGPSACDWLVATMRGAAWAAVLLGVWALVSGNPAVLRALLVTSVLLGVSILKGSKEKCCFGTKRPQPVPRPEPEPQGPTREEREREGAAAYQRWLAQRAAAKAALPELEIPHDIQLDEPHHEPGSRVGGFGGPEHHDHGSPEGGGHDGEGGGHANHRDGDDHDGQ